MKTWDEVKNNLTSLSEAEKQECAILAEFTNAMVNKGITEEDLAKLVGMDVDDLKYIFQFEKRIKLREAIAIADVLGLKFTIRKKPKVEIMTAEEVEAKYGYTVEQQIKDHEEAERNKND